MKEQQAMRHGFAFVLAGGIVLGLASSANAQFSLSVGNPYFGNGVSINSGYYGGLGYGSALPGIPGVGYGTGYGGGYPGYGGYSGYGVGYPGYGGGYPGYGVGGFAPMAGVTTYSSGYSGYVAPGTTSFVTGNYGAYPYAGYGYQAYRPVYGYSPALPYASYGYRRGWPGVVYGSRVRYRGW
jgi:hypothetical protein